MSQFIEDFVRQLDYGAFVLLMFLENVFPPIPSEIIMPLGGYLSANSELSTVGVVTAGTVGAVLGALLLYYLGRWLNVDRLKHWSEGHGHWLLLDPQDIERADRWFDQHGYKAVLLCRLIPGLRSLISIPAGSSGMQLGPFLILTTVGTVAWNLLLTYAGRLLGRQYTAIHNVLQFATYTVILLLILSVVLYVWRRKR